LLARAWLWAAEKPQVKRLLTESAFTRPVVGRFVAGIDAEDAIEVIKKLNSRGIGGILDFLGEGVVDPAGAAAAADQYLSLIERIDETGIDTTVSVKLTQLGLAFDKRTCTDHLRMLAREAQTVGASIEVDMEQSQYVSDTLELFRGLHADWPNVRQAIQVSLRRTAADLQEMVDLRPRIRLVKGAYAEPKEVAFQKRSEIDAQYRFLTDWLFERAADPAIATHDLRLIDHAREAAQRTRTGMNGFEVQMLYGVRREVQERLANQGHRVRIYVPFGSAWYPYLMRRIAERPANLWFFLRAVARD
jgi:proline dehydrogenase